MYDLWNMKKEKKGSCVKFIVCLIVNNFKFFGTEQKKREKNVSAFGKINSVWKIICHSTKMMLKGIPFFPIRCLIYYHNNFKQHTHKYIQHITFIHNTNTNNIIIKAGWLKIMKELLVWKRQSKWITNGVWIIYELAENENPIKKNTWELNKCDKLMSKNINEIIIYDIPSCRQTVLRLLVLYREIEGKWSNKRKMLLLMKLLFINPFRCGSHVIHLRQII